MKLTKHQEAEALKVYHLYWDSYTKGDLETFASTLDDDFETIGTSETEVAHNKADGIEIYKAQMPEIVGKVEMRNRIISAKPLNEMVLVNETCDVYVLGEPDWTFYSKLRLSTLLHETESGWKVIQQHGSLPDMRVQEGETLAFDKITKENLELRDAVKRRTIELENKSKELEIEAELERVRAVAMGMKKPEDMLDVCRVISDQLKGFGVDNIRNIQTAIIDEEKGIYLCYQYFTPYDKEAVEKTEYLKSPVEQEMVRQMLASRDGHFIGSLTGEELETFRSHRKEENHFSDPLLDETTEVSYSFLSIGEGGLGLSLYIPMEAEVLTLFRRFHQVFSLAYQRFRDIKKAESQAREAQIEAALERVRAQTMAMHSSEDVGKCIVKMFSELTALGVDEGTRFGIGILNHENENNQLWTAKKDGEEVKMHIGNLDMASHPLLKSARKAWKEQIPFHKYVLEGEDLLDYYRMLNNAPDYKIQIPIEKLPKKEIQHCFIFEHGFFYAFSPHEFQPELIHITKRFSSQFAQTYRRYLDLVKAEAQAREAEIELALERVRARTMAMHHTEELKEVIQVVFDQFVGLNTHVDHAGFILDYKERDDMHIWLADHQKGVPTEITIPYFDSPHWNSFLEAISKKESFYANLLPFEVKNKFYQDLFELIPDLTEEAQQAIFGKPALAISTALLDNVGLYIEHYSETPFTSEENAILMRFAKVFQQTYTRFLDLQKAEAQAREAQIEAALERVRSRTMAMQKSEELLDVASILFQQVKALGVPQWNCGFNIWDVGDEEFIYYPGAPDGIISESPCTIPLTEHPIFRKFDESRRRGDELLIYEKEGDIQRDHYQYMLSLPGVGDLLQSMLDAGFEFPTFQIDHVANFAYGNLIFITYEHFPEMHQVFKRFAKVFEQTYTRFLDLQKAEAQAKEAQIETSLERVRSRTMAMQSSAELGAVAAELFAQMNQLVTNLWTCGFVLCEKGRDEDEWWLSMDGDFTRGFFLPNVGDFAHATLYEGWLKGEALRAVQLDGESLLQHYDWLMEIPVSRKIFEEMDAAGLARPDWQKLHAAYFSKGYLVLITRELCGEEEIFKRFSQVFDQTYTRFLDLQKAEAQTREAQIQLALERVRARTMAMQKSEELAEVSYLLNKQVVELGIPTWGGAFNIYNEHDSTEWFSNLEGTIPAYQTPRENIFLTYYEAGQRGESLLIEEFGGERIKELYRYFASRTDSGNETVNDHIGKAPHYQINHLAYFKYGYLLFITFVPAPEAHDIFKRFAKEFEQTYTRFLDLQKAEEQVREAQIEAALERVRSRSMAMHTSQELKEVALELRKQMGLLGQKDLEVCAIHLYGYGEDSFESWSAMKAPGSEAEIVQSQAHFPKRGIRIVDELIHHYAIGTKDYVLVNEGEKMAEWFKVLKKHAPELHASILDSIGKGPLKQLKANWAVADFSGGALVMVTYGEPDEVSRNLLRRSANVFEQAYVRFLDLKKAEAQARESQIQLAMERVRARTMAMQRSEELPEVAALLFQQVKTLGVPQFHCGFNIFEIDDKECIWYPGTADGDILPPCKIPLTDHPVFMAFIESRKRGDELFVYEKEGEYQAGHYRYMLSLPVLGEILQNMLDAGIPFPTFQIDHLANFSHGNLLFITSEHFPEMHDTFKRFAKVFEQTYTRFLDLQKAEAQAREAQIEAALEKVRSRSLAMQKPEELVEVAELLRGEMGRLGVEELETSSIYLVDSENKQAECWYAIKDIRDGNKSLVSDEMTLLLPDTWVGGEMWKFFQSKKEQTSVVMRGDNRKEWINYCADKSQVLQGYYGNEIPERTYHLVKFNGGYMGAASPGEISPASWDLLKRASAVFSFAYTRFKDLQDAAARTREAQIELALEKVRGRTMAMQSSDELADAAYVLFEQLNFLGVTHERINIGIVNYENQTIDFWITEQGGDKLSTKFSGRISEPTTLSKAYAAWGQGAKSLVVDLQGAELKSWLNYLNDEIKIPFNKAFLHERRVQTAGFFSKGMLILTSPEPLQEEALYLLEKFAGVFDLTYTRFSDLKQAEAQAREAQIEVAMERIRAKALAMQSSTELNEVAKVLREQMGILGQEDLEASVVHLYSANSPTFDSWYAYRAGDQIIEGSATFRVENSALAKEFLKLYEDDVTEYTLEVKGPKLKEWLAEIERNAPKIAAYWGDLPPEKQFYHFSDFSGGALLMVSHQDPNEETRMLQKRCASVFELAYKRFLDLQAKEQQEKELLEEKKRLEQALSELKSTQSQLVQQEKLASLGQLTAGIAHEIKNPLNFVNNFSEVSIEMIEEIIEERTKSQESRDETLVDEILDDIRSNLKKVYEHGTRANGIVSSMLQHSREGSGKKEPTNLNALIREYSNLAFHGMRAGKNPINAEIDLQLDDKIINVPLIGEDFSRVLLNLCNNAFDAMRATAEMRPPKLTIRTKLQSEKVLIEVEDNGPGIPEEIKDKILQPFFTTKKGTEGTGLGLSITNDIIKAHGGELEIETSVNKGTTFIITLSK